MFKRKALKTESNSVFKFRYGDDKTFKRDLDDLAENRFYAPSHDKLNDPCETLILSEATNLQIDWLSRYMRKPLDSVKKSLQEMIERKNEVGIYSLSKTCRDELLWAHYANSHQGFCIEYDLNALLTVDSNDSPMYSFPVLYKKIPPIISINNILKNDLLLMIKKLAGTKSRKWSYEQEYRIVLEANGHRTYNHNALKAIYFGIRMTDEKKFEIMHRLQGRGIIYYQVYPAKNTYQLRAHQEEDIFGNSITYFKEIPREITKSVPVKFKIIERNYFWIYRKAKITIELESKVNEESLLWLGNQIRKDLFSQADRIFMFYNLKGIDNHGVCWASSHFENGEMNAVVNDFSWLEE